MPPPLFRDGEPFRLEVQTLQGEKRMIGGAGPVRIVEFWATWCNPCLPAMQALSDIALRHPEVDVWMVSIEEDLDVVRRFASQHEVPGVIGVLAPPPAKRPSVRSVPMVVVLDRAGHVVDLDYIGMIEAHLARAKQTPPTCHPTPPRPEHAAPP